MDFPSASPGAKDTVPGPRFLESNDTGTHLFLEGLFVLTFP